MPAERIDSLRLDGTSSQKEIDHFLETVTLARAKASDISVEGKALTASLKLARRPPFRLLGIRIWTDWGGKRKKAKLRVEDVLSHEVENRSRGAELVLGATLAQSGQGFRFALAAYEDDFRVIVCVGSINMSLQIGTD